MTITIIKPIAHDDLESPVSEFLTWYDKDMTVRQWIKKIDLKIYGQPCISDKCIDDLPSEELNGFMNHLVEVYNREIVAED